MAKHKYRDFIDAFVGDVQSAHAARLSDEEFAEKLERWDMIDQYEEMAKERGLTLKELYEQVLREALEEK